VVDDASRDAGCAGLEAASRGTARVRVMRLAERAGVPQARNAGVLAATGEVLFITDSHVRLERGWDRLALEAVAPQRVVAATIADPTSEFRGYGCSLVVPFMGTHWNRTRLEPGAPVQIPSCAGTLLTQDTFARIGGYDAGMHLYGAAEPEFGVRAWLSGAEVVAAPELRVWHRFKTRAEVDRLVREVRTAMVHNLARFGILYLSDAGVFQVLRLHAAQYPEQAPDAYRRLVAGDVWTRRAELQSRLVRSFAWFVERFRLRDQTGGEILV
jgi:glycosyltransferase involved in cell wall biosynthesis